MTADDPGEPATDLAAPTTPAAQPAKSPPRVYQGRGDDVVSIEKDPGLAIVRFECLRCTGNTVVKTDGQESLLVNEIGNYSGKRLIDVYDNSATSTLEIKATGAWKATVGSGLGMASTSTGTAVSGKGDDVVLLQGSSTKAQITNKGQSNFVVRTFSSASGMDLAVNTIGGYAGTVLLDAPAVVEIQSSGSWTLTPA